MNPARNYTSTILSSLLPFFLMGCGLSAELTKLLSSENKPLLAIGNKTPAIFANAANVTAVPVSGSCVSESGEVKLYVDTTLVKSISCSENLWSDSLDVSGFADADAHSISAQQGLDSALIADTATLIIDRILPQVVGLNDVLLPASSVPLNWGCADALDLCQFRFYVTQNPVFVFTTELFSSTTNTILLSPGQNYVYVQAIDKAKNLSTPVRIDTYVGTPKIFIGGLQQTETATGIENLNILAPSSLVEMALFNNATCTGAPTWTSYAAIVDSWSLDSAFKGGTAYVSALFRTAGGATTSCISDDISWPDPVLQTMCTDTTSSVAIGRLVDSGGTAGNYSDDESCTFSLNLTGPTQFTFDLMNTETNYDFLSMYIDGNEAFSNSGNDPIAPITVSSSNAHVEFTFTSDSSVNRTGFDIVWKPLSGSGPAPSTLVINNGETTAFTPTVVASLTYDSAFREMYLTEDPDCLTGGTWAAISSSANWTFSDTTNGSKDLFVKFRDVFHNESFCEGDSINLVGPEIIIDWPNEGDAIQNELALEGFCTGAGKTIEITGSISGTTTCLPDETWIFNADTSALANNSTVNITVSLKDGTTTVATDTASYVVSRNIDITSPAANAYTSTSLALSGNCDTPGATISSTSPSIASTTCSEGSWSLLLTASGADGDTVTATVNLIHNSTVQSTATRSFVLSTATPTVVISGTPTGTSTSSSVTMSVGGVNVSKYKYKFGAGIDCSVASGYSAETNVAINATLNLSAVPNGPITVCAVGLSSINGLWQPYNSATTTSWIKDTEANVNITSTNKSVNEGTANLELQVTLTAIKSTPTKVYYTYAGNSVYMLQHTLGEGYITIPANTLSASITFDILEDATADGDHDLAIYLTHTDNAAVTLGWDTLMNVLIKDNDKSYKTIVKSSHSGAVSCAIYSDAKMRCWGDNSYGQLGVGHKDKVYVATENSVGGTYLDVSVSGQFVCAVTTAFKMQCWGTNTYGQLGTGDKVSALNPTVIDSGTNYVSVALLSDAACGLTSGGTIKCWGANTRGQLGVGDTTERLSPTSVEPATAFTALTASADKACGITSTGVAKCWGANWYTTISNTSDTYFHTPVDVDNGTTYLSISPGNATCGITTSNQLKCWGLGNAGQVGNGSTTYTVSTRTLINPGTTYKKVAASSYFNCAITSTDDLECWGQGRGLFTSLFDHTVTTPTLVPSDYKFSEISLANTNAGGCALSMGGELFCMGDYQNMRLAPPFSPYFLDIYPHGTVATYTVGDRSICFIRSTGEASCQGSYAGSELYRETPMVISQGASYAGGKVVSTTSSACAIKANGEMVCAGYNVGGSVGDGTTNVRGAPVPVGPGIAFGNVYVGSYYCSAGISKTNKLYGWSSSCGQGSMTPRALDTATDYIIESLSGTSFMCAITTSNDMKCWGSDSSGGPLNGDVNSPMILDFGTKYKYVFTNYGMVCGITTADKLKCWGKGTNGRLGNGGIADSGPAVVDSAKNYQKVVIGERATCGLTTDGTLKCWGTAGDWSTSVNYFTPIVVNSGTTYADIAINSFSLMAVATSGALHYWDKTRFDLPFIDLSQGKTFVSTKADPAGYTACALTTDNRLYCNQRYFDGSQISKPRALSFTRW
ncbi:MAG: hypothetical protein OM95_06175 [Bdellovibrio sp. ArHS]|uniref:hypothetical protein n=1 Tax=Bdellovibrio sp. ArHS TaxID=1569284 RepID=UPI0005829940|nr:hypothetical protein [Bdellovibrio sp. ArHS]KHD89033.1 MAG: hypothetical protein OM95_06175 [Bdellovibrio sp. ArHS]